MANYKASKDSDFLLVAGKGRVIKTGEKVKVLQNPLAMTTTGVTFHDVEDDTNYQVPVGKTLELVGIFQKGGTTARVIKLIQNDDLDAKASEVSKYSITDWRTSGLSEELAFSDNISIESGKYVNVYTNNVTGTLDIMNVYGVEK